MRYSVSCMKTAGLLLGTSCPSAIMARFLTAMRGLVSCGRRLVRIDWWKPTKVLLSLQRWKHYDLQCHWKEYYQKYCVNTGVNKVFKLVYFCFSSKYDFLKVVNVNGVSSWCKWKSEAYKPNNYNRPNIYPFLSFRFLMLRSHLRTSKLYSVGQAQANLNHTVEK